MMKIMKRRSLETRFWKDSYIQSLTSNGKLLFNYLLMNEHVNIIHIYELPETYISLETGIPIRQIRDLKDQFQRDGKFMFKDSWIKIVNADKYEHYEGSLNDRAKENLLKIIPSRILQYFENKDFIKEITNIPKYKKSKGKYVHRIIAEKILKRKLKENEVVHHIDKNPSNNEIENLVVMLKEEHKLLHKNEITLDTAFLIPLSRGFDTHQKVSSNQYSITNNQQSITNKENSKDYMESITPEVISEIAIRYAVPESFVRSKLEDIELWEGEKPGRMKGRNWKLTLINWVKRDSLKIKTDYAKQNSDLALD